MNSLSPLVVVPLINIVALFALTGCGDQSSRRIDKAQDTSVQKVESNLTFNDITLEQADEQGRSVWKVKAAEATYSKDKKVAQVQSPTGQLFQDGKPVYKITAQQGEILQNGKQLFLKGQIVAISSQNGLVLRGNELEWKPEEDLLIVRNQLRGNQRQVQVVAQEARVHRGDRVELLGKVVAKATDPSLQIRTEHLIWQIQEQKLIGDRPVQIERYKGKMIDRGRANSAEVNLRTKIVSLIQNAQLKLLDPPLDVAGNSMSWNLNAEIMTADRPVRIVHRQQQVTLTAKQGQMDLQKEVVYLSGDVHGVGQRRQSINAKTLTWYLPSQLVEANGDVVYRQVKPPARFTGQKAIGRLQNQTIVVSGGRVEAEIVP